MNTITRRVRWAAVGAAVLAMPVVGADVARAGHTVASVSPTSGPIGTTVTVSGGGFTNTTSVFIGSRPLTIVSRTSTKIVGTVSMNASTGPVGVKDHNSTITAGTFTVTPGICCSRVAAPRSSFPLYAGGFTPYKLVTFDVRFNGTPVGTLGSAAATATGTAAIASARLPDSVLPGTYSIVATQGDLAGTMALDVRSSWGAMGSTARSRSSQPFEREITEQAMPSVDVDWTSYATTSIYRPMLAGGLVLTSQNNDLVALDPAGGTEVWRRDLGGYWTGAMAVSGSTVYASAGYNGFKAVNLVNGDVLWSSQACQDFNGDEFVYHLATSDGIVVAAMGDRVRAFRASDGVCVWTSTNTTNPMTFTSTLTIVNGAVVTNLHQWIVNFRLTDGQKMWELASGTTVWATAGTTTPSANGMVFYANGSQNPQAVLTATSSTPWVRADITAYNGAWAVGDGVVAVGASSNTTALNIADGTTRWTYAKRCPSGAHVNGLFFLTCDDANVHVVRASNGTLVARYGVYAASYEPVTVANGLVVMQSINPSRIVGLTTAGAAK